MGSYSSKEEQEEEIRDLKEVIKSLKWRLSKLEGEIAVMNKNMVNVKVSNNEQAKTIAKMHERIFDKPVMERDLSVRIPKLSRSLYAKN